MFYENGYHFDLDDLLLSYYTTTTTTTTAAAAVTLCSVVSQGKALQCQLQFDVNIHN